MITCAACATENEDFFMFCLNCGAELGDESASGTEDLETREYTAADLGVEEVLAQTEAAAIPEPPHSAEPPAPPGIQAAEVTPPEPEPEPPPAPPQAPAAPRTKRGRLILIREDGTDGPTYELFGDRTLVGRDSGDLKFPQDEFLGSEHAVFVK